jgi:hypothetical protein
MDLDIVLLKNPLDPQVIALLAAWADPCRVLMVPAAEIMSSRKSQPTSYSSCPFY